MRTEIKLKIGEFSRLMQTTVKTLRHYEQIGLLLPDEVDEATGYRYYRMEQMQRLNAIKDLKSLGFSLDEIKDIYDDDTHTPSLEILEAKIDDCRRQLRELEQRRLRLAVLADSRKQLLIMEKFSIQSLPEIIVASHREVVENYDAIGAMCVNVIGPEMQRLGCKCPPPGYCFTIEHDKEYKPKDIDIEYCEQVEEAGKDSAIITFKRLPAVPTALCMKHVGPYDRFYQSYVELFKYAEEQGYQIAGAPRTCYIDGCWNQEDPEKWLSLIQLPVILP
ncbi:MAG: MerR family transcriptional regulator [Candidatus Limisoma sp.]